MTTSIDLTTTTYGVEIEACVPVQAVRDLNIRVGGYHRGIDVVQLPAGWNAQSDGSICCDVGYVGIEFVSPKLQGEDGLRQIEVVCEWLNSIGAKVNASTGLHVHVGVDSLDAAGLARLIALVSYYEKAIYASTGSTKRETGSYCRSIKAKYEPVKKASKADATILRRIAGDHYDRYHILNLHPLATGQRQAVEFRAFAGTTSALKIKAHVQVCLALVHKAQTSDKMNNWDAKVSTNAKYAGKGEGWISLTYMLKRIGWIATRSTQPVFGLLRPTEVKEYVKEMQRLADKYDSRV